MLVFNMARILLVMATLYFNCVCSEGCHEFKSCWDCSTFLQNVTFDPSAACGWCELTQECISLPENGTCSGCVDFFDCSRTLCGELTTCQNCTSNINCGWCEITQTCLPKDGLDVCAPFECEECFKVQTVMACSSKACSEYKNCYDCIGDQCGWCEATQTCMPRKQYSAGPCAPNKCEDGFKTAFSEYCPTQTCGEYKNCDDCATNGCGWCAATQVCIPQTEREQCKDCFKTYGNFADIPCPSQLCSSLSKSECHWYCNYCHISETCLPKADFETEGFCSGQTCEVDGVEMDNLKDCPVLFVPYIIELLTLVLGNVTSLAFSYGLIYCSKPGNFAMFLSQLVAFLLDFFAIGSIYIEVKDIGLSGWECYQCIGLLVFNGRIYASCISLLTLHIGMLLAMEAYEGGNLLHLNSEQKDYAQRLVETHAFKKIDKQEFSSIKPTEPGYQRAKYIQRFLLYRCYVCLLAVPFLVTHFIPAVFFTIWPVIFLVVCCYVFSYVSSRSWEGWLPPKVFVVIFLLVCVPVVMMGFHSVFQNAVILYSGVPWVDMFATEYRIRYFDVYLDDKIASIQNILYLIHVVI